MPPQQCPECGRFLKHALVVGLVEAPAPCPKCGVELTAPMFGDGEVATPAPEPTLPDHAPPVPTAVPTPSPAAVTSPSVRPPDLVPAAVRDRDDPLAGWDVGVPLTSVTDRRPFPTDTVVVAAGAALGAVAGSIASDRRVAGASAGAAAGALTAGALRRVWRLPDA